MSNPIVDQLAQAFADQLSFETKLGMYKDAKDANLDLVNIAMCCSSIESAVDEFVFQLAWQMQHRLLNEVLSEEEIDERIG